MQAIHKNETTAYLMSELIVKRMRKKSERLKFYKFAYQFLSERYEEDHLHEDGVCHVMRDAYISKICDDLCISIEKDADNTYAREGSIIFSKVRERFSGESNLFKELYAKATTPFEPYFFRYQEERLDALEEVIREMEMEMGTEA